VTAEVIDLVRLAPLMDVSAGSAEIAVAVIDGPVADHPDLATQNVRRLAGATAGTEGALGIATAHATFVAGILAARRDSAAPGICPGCTLLVKPIFLETGSNTGLPSATCDETADAIAECVDAGAHIINLSIGLTQLSPNRERRLEDALRHAARRGVIITAAAGNQRAIGSTPITRHPWVIPVAACDRSGRPSDLSSLGASIGRRGLCAPGDAVTSLAAGGGTMTSGGTSVATPFVTGTAALLWSAFPEATAVEIARALTSGHTAPRTTIVPPLLNAWSAYQAITVRRAPMRTA
jgi:subtilisin family serine protease